MKSIDNFNFKDKKVLIRVDYNVPLNEQLEVMDTTRIVRTKDIDKLWVTAASCFNVSLGRPKGR